MRLQLGSFISGHGNGNDRAADTAGTAKSSLRGNKDVRDVLVFTQQGQVEQDFEGFGVGGHDYELGDTAVEGLGGFVGTLAKLLVVGGLLDEIEDAVGEGVVSEGISFRVRSRLENLEKTDKERL